MPFPVAIFLCSSVATRFSPHPFFHFCKVRPFFPPAAGILTLAQEVPPPPLSLAISTHAFIPRTRLAETGGVKRPGRYRNRIRTSTAFSLSLSLSPVRSTLLQPRPASFFLDSQRVCLLKVTGCTSLLSCSAFDTLVLQKPT